ncbi:MAG: agmatine deiminase family protein [Muribaculaceae bacterium]|nr:agmatine deiminase family protein [Muribaculaceae bacterium]
MRFRAEWEPQEAVLIAWPHTGTDWAATLDTVQSCYCHIARAIMADERLIVVTPEPDTVRRQLPDAPADRLTIVELPTNDTWTRDYGPLTVEDKYGIPRLLDFTFNAWGMKFPANLDNLVTERLCRLHILDLPLDNHRDMVLEGGSVETDGRGTVMTTYECLLSRNRNAAWHQRFIEQQLRNRLGARQVLWLVHGHVPGDDTDCHIDTLARFLPGNVIVTTWAESDSDEYRDIAGMVKEISTFTDADGQPYRCVQLPAPPVLRDSSGNRLPATYANFLITNHSVLVPTYGCPERDNEAVQILQQLVPQRRVVGIDCRPLIEQHGSLHCATMQIPKL